MVYVRYYTRSVSRMHPKYPNNIKAREEKNNHENRAVEVCGRRLETRTNPVATTSKESQFDGPGGKKKRNKK